MMSQLSARLLAGNTSIAESMATSVSLASSSGYAGDVERRLGHQQRSVVDSTSFGHLTKSRPPPVIDFSSSSGDGHHHHHHKRRKLHHHSSIAEANYASTTVWKDLERGGLTTRKISRIQDFSYSFLSPNVKIDPSHVDLVAAKDYHPELDDSACNVQSDLYTNTTALSCLLGQCHAYYRSALTKPAKVESKVEIEKVIQQGTLTKQNLQAEHGSASSCKIHGAGTNSRTTASDFESSTSSMTDSSDDGTSPEETAGGSQTTSSAAKSNDDSASSETNDGPASEGDYSPKSYVRMGDALANSKVPRLIALSFSPFVVVHVNSPYTRLTGQRSVHVLGRPLHGTFLRDPVISAALQTSCPQFTLASLDGQAVRMRSTPSPPPLPPLSSSASDSSEGSPTRCAAAPSSHCTVRVQPIGQEGPSRHITHYLLEIVPAGDQSISPGDSDEEAQEEGEVGASATLSVNVMG